MMKPATSADAFASIATAARKPPSFVSRRARRLPIADPLSPIASLPSFVARNSSPRAKFCASPNPSFSIIPTANSIVRNSTASSMISLCVSGNFAPQVLLTFGAEGGVTGHPDHSMAGIFATLAFHWAGRSNRYADQLESGLAPHRTQKLYHGTSEFALPKRQPITFAPPTAIVDIGDQLEVKVAAFKAHKTQSPLFPLFEGNVRQVGRREMFHLAASVS